MHKVVFKGGQIRNNDITSECRIAIMRRTSSTCSSSSSSSYEDSRKSTSSSASSSPVSKSSRRKSSESIKLLVVGDKAVGKSALTVRLLTKRFIGNYSSDKDQVYKRTYELTIDEDLELAQFDHSDALLTLEILDTTQNNQNAGTEPTVAALQRLNWSSAIVIVYDITNAESFYKCRQILKVVRSEHPNHPILVLGNKTDLEHMRQVSKADLTKLVSSYKSCSGIEVSAADGFLNVQTAFNSLLKDADNLMKNHRAVKRRKSLVDVAKSFTNLIRNARNTASFRKST